MRRRRPSHGGGIVAVNAYRSRSRFQSLVSSIDGTLEREPARKKNEPVLFFIDPLRARFP